MTKTQRGFTLIELMMAVAVIGILAAIAYPSYIAQARRSNRSEAKVALMQIQVAQEKFFLQNNRYARDNGTINELTLATASGGLGFTTGKTPQGYYSLTFDQSLAATPAQFKATATPLGAQLNDTTCPSFSITETGVKTPAETSGCWR